MVLYYRAYNYRYKILQVKQCGYQVFTNVTFTKQNIYE